MKISAIPQALKELEAAHRLRLPDDGLDKQTLAEQFQGDFIDAASNDYLGLAGRSSPSPAEGMGDVSRETSGASSPPGAGASRLIFGTAAEHLAVEKTVSGWLGMEAALFFSSGYAANLGALSALLSEGDAVFSDRLNHASLIDGMRLARVKPQVFEHLDLGQLEEGLASSSEAPARWVVLEAYYSMDGDAPNLHRVRDLCDEYDANLYVDEAHSVGTFGPAGAGLCAQAGVRADVLMAAFGKAVGSSGACVLSSQDVRTWLWNRARSFVFSTAPSPIQASSLQIQMGRTRAAHGARDRLSLISTRVRETLSEAGIHVLGASFGPVLSLLCGSEDSALGLAARLRDSGVLAQAIRPPTVPDGSSRVRLILRASFTDDQVTRLIEIVARETSRGGLGV